MPYFSITFLLALPYQQENPKGKNKMKNDLQLKDNDQKEEFPIAYEVGKPFAFFHIEYSLVPDSNKFAIDLTCWEQFAKVYLEEQYTIMKTIIKNDMTWIAFTVNHTVNLKDDRIIKFHNNTVTFSVWTSHNKQGNRAKNDKPKAIYSFRVSDTESTKTSLMFEKLFDSSTPHKSQHSLSMDKFLEEQTFFRAISSIKISSISAIPTVDHVKSIVNTIDKFKIEDKLPIKIPVPAFEKQILPHEMIQKRGTKQRAKNIKPLKIKGGIKKSDKCYEFKIRAEEFFTDNNEVRGEVKPLVPDLTYATAIASVDILLNEKQKRIFNPLIVRLVNIRNLPHEFLLKNRISSIFFRYNVMNSRTIESYQYPVARKIMLDDVHAVLTDGFDSLTYLEFLQTGLLCVELHGILDEEEQRVKPSVFGQEMYDSHMSRKLISTSNEVRCLSLLEDSSTVHLASASYDLSSLAVGPNILELSCILKIPLKGSSSSEDSVLKTEYRSFERVETPFTNLMLAEHNTCLNVTVKITSSLKNTLRRVQAMKNILNRILLVLNDHNLAKEIILTVYDINQTYLGPSPVTKNLVKVREKVVDMQELFKREASVEDTSILLKLASMVEINTERNDGFPEISKVDDDDEKVTTGGVGSPYYAKKALTGFVIDSFDKIIIFIEGEMNGALQKIWNIVMTLPRNKGRLLYDSNLVFRNRLYPIFLAYGGFHIVNLRAPLDYYLKKPKTFMEGNIPPLCWKTLMKLDLLLKTRTMRSASQNQLFPSSVFILNYDMEFGVPLYYNADLLTPQTTEQEEENVDITT